MSKIRMGVLLNGLLYSRIIHLRDLFVPLIIYINIIITQGTSRLHMCLCFMLQFPLEYGAVLIPVKFVLLEAVLLTRVWWRCTVVDSGELCAMIYSVNLKLTLCVDNWDMREHMTMIISACEKFIIFLVTHRSCSLMV